MRGINKKYPALLLERAKAYHLRSFVSFQKRWILLYCSSRCRVVKAMDLKSIFRAGSNPANEELFPVSALNSKCVKMIF